MNAALRLIATGGALPGRTVTNEDLSRMVNQRRVDHHPHRHPCPALVRRE